jgi:uncharacterized protein
VKKIIQQYAKDLTAGRLASGYEHSYRTYHLARQIGEGMDYDDEILHAACFLHDIGTVKDHPRASAKKAVAILEETGFTAGKISKVKEAILEHMPGDAAKSTEGKLLHDANLLEGLGAIGFARLAIGAFFWNHYKSLDKIIGMLERELLFSDSFIFEKSRKMAEEKRRFTRTAIDELGEELKL